MGTKDTITKKYMRNPNHFADFFNGYIYNGREEIKANALSEVDTSNITVVPYHKGNKNITVQKYRDILKKVILMKSDKAYYLFLGIENQTEIHYAMPVRNMLYDSLVYNQQIEQIAKYNRENGLCDDSREFLSGFTKNDKLTPIISVTVYWGTTPWNAPTSLLEMIDDMDDNAKVLFQDYNCNLFSIIDSEELPKFNTELKELFNLLRLRNNTNELRELLLNDLAYRNIDKETAIMMAEFSDIKIPRRNKEGKYNMCKAIMELEKRSADNALINAIKNAMTNTKQTFEDVCKMLGISPEDMERYKEII